MKPVTHIVLHCTATPGGRPVTAEDIHQWHIVENQWDEPGYSDLIGVNGELINLQHYNQDEFKDPWEITNGVYGHNTHCHHIALAGGRLEWLPSLKQSLTLKAYLDYHILRWPDVLICGHDYFNQQKDCPNFKEPVPHVLREYFRIPEGNILEY